MSKFFHGQEQLETHYEKQKKQAQKDAQAGKPRNVMMEAIDNVMMVRKIRNYYKNLEHMVRWELGMPDLWVDIVAERDRLISERKKAEDAKKLAEEQAQKKRELRIFLIRQNIYIVVAVILGIMIVIGTVCGMEMLVEANLNRRMVIYQ